MSNGDVFLSRSTCSTKETIEFEGETYPLVKLEISNTSHPFYTGKSKLVDTAGRVDKFMSRYGNRMKKVICNLYISSKIKGCNPISLQPFILSYVSTFISKIHHYTFPLPFIHYRFFPDVYNQFFPFRLCQIIRSSISKRNNRFVF